MISAVFEALDDLGLLADGAGPPYPPYNIHLLRKPNIEVFVGDGRFFHVKLADASDDSLAHEYEALIEAYAVLPDRLSKPLAYRQLDGTNLLVTVGIQHRRASPDFFHRPHPGVADGLNDYFDTADRAFRLSDANESHADFACEVLNAVSSAGIGGKLQQWRKSVDFDILNHLPHIKQHGDFTLNNLGFGEHGLVIFDWEEFGKERLPGLDLCMLIASSFGFAPERVAHFFDAGDVSPLHDVVERFCRVHEIEVTTFRSLFLLYLATFLRSKEINLYKNPVKEKTLHLIEQL